MNRTYSTSLNRFRSVKYRSSPRLKQFYLDENSIPINRNFVDKATTYTLIKKFPKSRTIQSTQISNLKRQLTQTTAIDTQQLKQNQKYEMRVLLPKINDNELSLFTTLDSLTKPLEYIQNQFSKINIILIKQKQIVKQLQKQYEITIKNKNQQLELIYKSIKQKILKLQSNITINNIHHQQNQLKYRSNLDNISNQLSNYQQSIFKLNNQCLKLQHNIFQNQPYQLTLKQQHKNDYEIYNYF